MMTSHSLPSWATKYWPNWAIVNKATLAWGTSHAYLMVSRETEGVPLPSAVVYSMIPDHISRNYIRKSWLRELSRFDREQPHFEIIDGKLAFQGVVGIEQGMEDSPELRQKELGLTNAFLVGMQTRCAEKSVPLFVVLLSKSDWPPVIIKTLVENQIHYLDLSETKIDYFPHDSHPNESGHRQIAAAIANSFINTEILRLEANLFHPGEGTSVKR